MFLAAKYKAEIPPEYADLYRNCKIAMLTGWHFEYIETLGLLNSEALLQVYEAEQKLKAQKPRKKKGRRC